MSNSRPAISRLAAVLFLAGIALIIAGLNQGVPLVVAGAGLIFLVVVSAVVDYRRPRK